MYSPAEVLRDIPEINVHDLFPERAYQVLTPISWRYPFFELMYLMLGQKGAFGQFSISLNDRKRKGHAGLLSACAAVFFRKVFVQFYCIHAADDYTMRADAGLCISDVLLVE